MGGPACKEIICYSWWEAESLGLSKLAEMLDEPALAAAALTMSNAAHGGWVAGLEVLHGEYAAKHLAAVLDESYHVEAWAGSVMEWRLTLSKENDAFVEYGDGWLRTIEKWLAQDREFFIKIAESDFPAGYKQPTTHQAPPGSSQMGTP